MTDAKVDSFFDQVGTPGFLKAGLLGFQGTGKSMTAATLAVVTREHFKLQGPIAIYDTESGSGYLEGYIQAETGIRPLIKKSRSFQDLMTFTQKAMEAGASVAIADSITHPWRELCDSYLKQRNEARQRWAQQRNKNYAPQTNLEFQDWNPVKSKWAEFADLYLNSPLHYIINGRAGFEYDREENEETHKKELVKTGIKMRAENEFGYEPSLLVQMALDRQLVRNRLNSVRSAVVLKDRFMVLDGHTATFPSTTDFKKALGPVRKFFMPHLERLVSGSHVPVDTGLKTEFNVDTEGDSDWQHEKRLRVIVSEEIEGVLVEAYPGQTKEEKQSKARLLKLAFDTFSWTAIQNLPSEVLRKGLRTIVSEIKGPDASPASEPGAEEAAALMTDLNKAAGTCPLCKADLTSKKSGTFCGECGWNPTQGVPSAPAECQHPLIAKKLKPGKTVVCPDCSADVRGPEQDEREELTLTAPNPARHSGQPKT